VRPVGVFSAVPYEILRAMIAGTALLGVWCYFHLVTWWWPYVRGVENAGKLRFHV
jgi:hypothetical protein